MIYHLYLSQEGGLRGLFRGIVPSWVGMIPYAGLAFYCFELCKFVCIKEFPTYTCHYETQGQPCRYRYFLQTTFGTMVENCF
jgi:hypothetical protein